MSHEIVNTLRAKSLVRIVGNSATLITLSDLSKDSRETIQQAIIAQASGVTDGVWRIYRGNNTSGELVLELPSVSNFVFYDLDSSLANSATSNVYVTNSGTAGTLILQLSKVATYSPALEGM